MINKNKASELANESRKKEYQKILNKESWILAQIENAAIIGNFKTIIDIPMKEEYKDENYIEKLEDSLKDLGFRVWTERKRKIVNSKYVYKYKFIISWYT